MFVRGSGGEVPLNNDSLGLFFGQLAAPGEGRGCYLFYIRNRMQHVFYESGGSQNVARFPQNFLVYVVFLDDFVFRIVFFILPKKEKCPMKVCHVCAKHRARNYVVFIGTFPHGAACNFHPVEVVTPMSVSILLGL